MDGLRRPLLSDVVAEGPSAPEAAALRQVLRVSELLLAVALWLFLVIVLEAHTIRHYDDD